MSKILIVFVAFYLGCIYSTLFIETSWGVILYVSHYFVNPRVRWWGSLLPDFRYSFIIAVFLIVAYVIKQDQYRQNRIFDIPQTKWLLAMLIMMILLTFYAVWPSMHSNFLTAQFKLFFFLIVAYKVVDTPKKFERLIWAFMIGNAYIGWVAHSTGRNGDGRLEGVGPADAVYANGTASVLVTAVPILLFYILNGKGKQKYLALLLLAFVFDGLVLINSRGAFLGLVGSCAYLFYFLLFNKVKKLKKRLKILGVIILGLCLFVYVTDASFWERMGSIKDDAESGEGGATRIYFWIKTFDLVKEHPFGVGAWGYQYLSPNFLPPEMLSEGRRAVHSTYFEMLAEFGYFGPVILFGYLFSNFNLSKKVRKHALKRNDIYLFDQNVALNASFISFLIAAVFINRVYAEMLYWHPMFMGCFANIYLLKGHESSELEGNKK